MEALCNISLESLSHNYSWFAARVAPAQVIPVVKANAYGHGAVAVTSHLFRQHGAALFAVATLEEAIQLNEALPEIQVLILSRVFPGELGKVLPTHILTIGSSEDAQAVSAAASRPLNVHLNVNTGMNRLGLSPAEAVTLIKQAPKHIQVAGVYSHFSSSDTPGTQAYDAQLHLFSAFETQLDAIGFQGIKHLANSAAALHPLVPGYHAMRLGIGLYGFDTLEPFQYANALQPVMEVQAPLIRVARIPAGESVSYAERWRTTSATNIGTLRIGYADGYSRRLTNRGQVVFKDKSYPVVGTVTMDHIMIDLGDDTPPTGSYFTVLGGQHPATRMDNVAKHLETIPYELCCAVGQRVRRYYLP